MAMAMAMASPACSLATSPSTASLFPAEFSSLCLHQPHTCILSFLPSPIPSSSRIRCTKPFTGFTPVWKPSNGRARNCVVCSLKKLSEVESVELNPESVAFPASPGIYAVYDKAGDLQYVGLSRRVSSSLQSHVRELPEICATVKFAVIDAPERAALTEAWKTWMEEHINNDGNVPPGNVAGNTTWTARKARAAKPEIKLTPRPNTKLTVPLETLIGKVVEDCRVVAFIKGTRTSPQCGFSHRVLTILNEHAVDYEVLNVLDENHNPGLREAIKNYSQWPTIPQLYVKGEFVGGADVLDEMVKSGELKELFRK